MEMIEDDSFGTCDNLRSQRSPMRYVNGTGWNLRLRAEEAKVGEERVTGMDRDLGGLIGWSFPLPWLYSQHCGKTVYWWIFVCLPPIRKATSCSVTSLNDTIFFSKKQLYGLLAYPQASIWAPVLVMFRWLLATGSDSCHTRPEWTSALQAAVHTEPLFWVKLLLGRFQLLSKMRSSCVEVTTTKNLR